MTRIDMPVIRTGTDNVPMVTEAVGVATTVTTDVSLDEPTWQRSPARNPARSLEIPTFLRKQAD